LFPRETLESLGPLRSDFFVGLEDTEYAERMERAGLMNVSVPEALAFHPNKGNKRFGIRPSVLRSYYSTRNSVYLEVQLHRDILAVPLYLARALAGILRTLIQEDGKISRIAARSTATFDGITGRMGRREYWFMQDN